MSIRNLLKKALLFKKLYACIVVCARYARIPSLEPDLPRKSFLRRWFEQVYCFLNDGMFFEQYSGLRCDLIGHSLHNVVREAKIHKFMRPIAIKRGEFYVGLLDDKYLFELYLSKFLNKGVIPIFAHINCGKCFVNGEPVSRETLKEELKKHPVFASKAVTLLCGWGFEKVTTKNGDFISSGRNWSVDERIDRGDYLIFQDFFSNHPEIAKINPTSLNTLRVSTCWKNGKVELFDDAILRMGRTTACVDNFAQGGLGVGITKEGRGYPYAISHTPDFVYSKYYEHPDSKVKFSDFKLPFYKEAIDLTLKAHEYFPSVPTIGWDVAITSEGPKLLEGNCNWDICLLQAVLNHDLAARFDEIYAGMRL